MRRNKKRHGISRNFFLGVYAFGIGGKNYGVGRFRGNNEILECNFRDEGWALKVLYLSGKIF